MAAQDLVLGSGAFGLGGVLYIAARMDLVRSRLLLQVSARCLGFVFGVHAMGALSAWLLWSPTIMRALGGGAGYFLAGLTTGQLVKQRAAEQRAEPDERRMA